MKKILLIEDDRMWSRLLKDELRNYGEVTHTSTKASANEVLSLDYFDMAFIDLDLNGEDKAGTSLIAKARQKGIYSTVVSSHDEDDVIDYCISHCRANDYFIKPEDLNSFKSYIKDIFLGHERYQKEDEAMSIIETEFFTVDRSLKDYLFKKLKRTGDRTNGVLVVGETGTGKTHLIENVISKLMNPDAKVIRFDCGSFNKELIDSELFGYAKGSHSKADKDKPGKIEQADGGILFLDDLQNLSDKGQQNLRTVLEGGFYYPVGAEEPKFVNLRVICGATDELDEKIKNKKFRSDVYHRLSKNRIDTQPLRSRKKDVLPLVKNFVKEFYPRGRAFSIREDAKEELTNYSWPGNTRELRNLVESWSNNDLQVIGAEDLELDKKRSEYTGLTDYQKSYLLKHGQKIFLNYMKNELLAFALDTCKNNNEAANLLGVNKGTISRARRKVESESELLAN